MANIYLAFIFDLDLATVIYCMITTNKSWYAVYTKSRAEKKVLLELELQKIEAYLPLQKKLRQWSDRKKWVETPLISGYIFVHISKFDYDRVLQAAGVVSYVQFEGKAANIPNEQIKAIKRLLRQHDYEVEVSLQNYCASDLIEITAGPLMGLKGTLITLKGKKRVAIHITQLNLALSVELPLHEIQKAI